MRRVNRQPGMRTPGRRGYTLMEVMVSLAVLAIGSSGIVALQKVTGVGNVNTRNIATANRVAAKWAERLQFDSLRWTETSGFTSTYWLKSATAPPGQWFVPLEVVSFASPDADVLGADIFPGDPASSAFCTNVRLVLLPGNQKTVRAEIRVFWEKAGIPASCTTSPAIVSASPNRYGFVYNLVGIVASQ